MKRIHATFVPGLDSYAVNRKQKYFNNSEVLTC